jgi:hypothetical protein
MEKKDTKSVETQEKFMELTVGIQLRRFLIQYKTPGERIDRDGLTPSPYVAHSTTDDSGDYIALEESFATRVVGFLGYLKSVPCTNNAFLPLIGECIDFFVIQIKTQMTPSAFRSAMEAFIIQCERSLQELGFPDDGRREANEEEIIDQTSEFYRVRSFDEIKERQGPDTLLVASSAVTAMGLDTAGQVIRTLVDLLVKSGSITIDRVRQIVGSDTNAEIARLQRKIRQLQVDEQVSAKEAERLRNRLESATARNQELSAALREATTVGTKKGTP